MYYYRFYTRTKPNGKVYVGRSRKKYISDRWSGSYSFDTTDTIDEVIFECDCDERDADIIESYFIMKYNAVRKGLNKNYGNAMNRWYKACPEMYKNWNHYIDRNYYDVKCRLEDWMRWKKYL